MHALIAEPASAPLAGFLLALVVGVVLGMLGGGGSILTVPIFVYVLGFATKPAIAMSLPVIGLTSLVGVIGHWRAGRVNVRVALIFGVVAMLGSVVGTRVATLVSGSVQMAIFGTVMIAAAAFMFRSAPPEAKSDEPGLGLLGLAPIGFVVGTLTGLVGVGGGFLIVPALVLLGRLPMKHAVGTSLLVIAMNAFAAFAGYLGRVPLDWSAMILFAALAIVGILLGSWLVRFVPQQTLKRAFAVLLILMGSVILYQNRDVLRGGESGASAASLIQRP